MNLSIEEKAKLVLTRGGILRVLFLRNTDVCYAIICETKTYNKLKKESPVNSEYLDILREVSFDFNDKNIIGYDCFDLPPNIIFSDFFPDAPLVKTVGEDFLLHDEAYIKKVIETIDSLKARYISNYISHLERYYVGTEDNLKDLLLIRFYPQIVSYDNREQVLELVKTSIADNYHNLEIDGGQLIPALAELGATTNNILNTTDSRAIEAVRHQWVKLIQQERDNAKESIKIVRQQWVGLRQQWIEKDTEQLDANQLDDQQLQQFSEYEDMLDDINGDIVKTCNSVKEIISTWPAILQPQPWYIYEN